MKDENGKRTADHLEGHGGAGARGGSRRPARQSPTGFNVFRSVDDSASQGRPAPKVGHLVIAGGMYGGWWVPVSFAAKDWNVSPRRIRALLASGRLLGRLLENGYWEVKHPYQFTFGTRGPSLKRQQRPPKRLKPAPEKPEVITE